MQENLKRFLYAGRPDRQQGYALFAGLLLLVIVGVGLSQVWSTWQQTQAKQESVQAQRNLNAIRQATNGLYQGQDGYGSGTDIASTLATNDLVPASLMASGGGLENSWGGTISVDGNGNTYTIETQSIPQDACARLATKAWGGNLDTLSINGTTVSTTANGRPDDPTAATGNCSDGTTLSLTYR